MLLLCRNSSVLRATAYGHRTSSIPGLNLPAPALQSRWKAELGASPHRLSPPLRAGPSRDRIHTASICVRASLGGSGAGAALLLSDIQGLAEHNGWHKAKSKQLPKDVALEKLYLGKCSGHYLTQGMATLGSFERNGQFNTNLYLSCTFCFMSCSESWDISRSRYPESTSVAFSKSAWLFCKDKRKKVLEGR